MTEDAAGIDWGNSGCMIYWEYSVPGDTGRFEAFYGPNGQRAALFEAADGFIRSDLQRDANNSTIYRTADYWASRDAFLAFLRDHSADYDALSKESEGLSSTQTSLGMFLIASKD